MGVLLCHEYIDELLCNQFVCFLCIYVLASTDHTTRTRTIHPLSISMSLFGHLTCVEGFMLLLCNWLKLETENTQVPGERWGSVGGLIGSGNSLVLREEDPMSKCVAV